MRIVIPLMLMTGCFSEGSFVKPISAAYCARLDECDKGHYEGKYSDRGDCIDDVRAPWDDFQDCAQAADCGFNANAAAECHHDLVTMSCEDFVQSKWQGSCDNLYDCSFVAGATCHWEDNFFKWHD